MADREKVRLMTRLAIYEERYGKQIKKAENTSRIDLVTNPVWRWGFGITVLFFLLIGTLAVLNMDMVLDAVAKDQTKNLIMIVLIAWLSILAVTIVVTFVVNLSRWHRMDGLRQQYRKMLLQLERINKMSMDNGRGRRSSSGEEDLWDEPSGRERGRRRKGTSEEDLDYRNMQVLEFEDDEYCYYVEAVPKRGGRRR